MCLYLLLPATSSNFCKKAAPRSPRPFVFCGTITSLEVNAFATIRPFQKVTVGGHLFKKTYPMISSSQSFFHLLRSLCSSVLFATFAPSPHSFLHYSSLEKASPMLCISSNATVNTMVGVVHTGKTFSNDDSRQRYSSDCSHRSYTIARTVDFKFFNNAGIDSFKRLK